MSGGGDGGFQTLHQRHCCKEMALMWSASEYGATEGG